MDGMKQVLFLCSGNYYRSRFAEHLFNWLAPKASLPWRPFTKSGTSLGRKPPAAQLNESSFIHRNRVGKSELVSGDQLIIGRTEVTVRYLGAAQTAIEAEVRQPLEPKPSPTRPSETLELLY
jgi:hypothetical protein